MAVTPTYPNGILPWVNRIDKTNIVYANDPNTLAADLIAVESTLGTNPQVEVAPPVGPKVVYSNVSARIHDVQQGNQIPVFSILNTAYTIKFLNRNPVFVTYNSLLDPYSFFNGRDITVQASGWYVITVEHSHEWSSSGFFDMDLLVNSTSKRKHRWSWDFPENTPRSPGFTTDPAIQEITWQGVLHKGDRLSVTNMNNTGKSIISVSSAYLKGHFVRSVSATATG